MYRVMKEIKVVKKSFKSQRQNQRIRLRVNTHSGAIFSYGDKGGHSEVLKFLKCYIVGPSIDINDDVSLVPARLSAAEADGGERDEEEQEERVSGVELGIERLSAAEADGRERDGEEHQEERVSGVELVSDILGFRDPPFQELQISVFLIVFSNRNPYDF